jgi:DNA-binding XRE family transcriptional regulator
MASPSQVVSFALQTIVTKEIPAARSVVLFLPDFSGSLKDTERGDAMTFGERLKQLRVAAGMTQEELAKKAKIARVTLARLETNVFGPSWQTALMLAKALGVGCEAFEGKVGAKK